MRNRDKQRENKTKTKVSWWYRLPEWLRVGIVLILMLVAGWLTVVKKLLIHQNPVPMEVAVANPKTAQRKMKIGRAEILVEVRKTIAEQELGLSYRISMGEEEGMVFEYAQPQRVMYWMRGMEFPLDFLWVRQGKVVEISTNVAAPTKEQPIPRTLVPLSEIDMVIEVNAGWIEANDVGIGDEVAISY